jgi:hypothetical protein
VVAVFVLLLAGLSVGAGGVDAAPHIPNSFRHFEMPPATYLRAGVETTSGYRLQVGASRVDVPAEEGHPARTTSFVYLTLGKRGSSVEYYPRHSRLAAAGTVEADFGDLGRVAGSFVALHRHHEPVPWCDGDYMIETGLLVGVLVFHGEHGYARARSASVPATRTRQPAMRCHIPASVKPQKQHDSSKVGGTAGRHGRQVAVEAYEHPALGTVTVLAYSSERRRAVSIIRRVSAVAPLASLAITHNGESATLDAPPPFTGSATYTAFRGKEAGTWRGDLAVDFPGEPGVRLAGKRFQGARLKPGECAPDSGDTCIGIKAPSPVGLKPELPVTRGG